MEEENDQLASDQRAPDEDAQPEETVQPEPRKPYLTAEDKKVAMITFAATAAANIVTVVIVGLGLILYRFLTTYRKHPLHITVWHVVLYSLLLALGLSVISAVLFIPYKNPAIRRIGKRAGTIVFWALPVLFALWMLVLALATLGELAASH